LQRAALGFAKVILPQALPAGLMKKCTAECRLGRCVTTGSIAHDGLGRRGVLNRYIHLRPMQENVI